MSDCKHTKIECVDVIEDWDLGWREGEALRFIHRAQHSDRRAKDLRLAVSYLVQQIKYLGGRRYACVFCHEYDCAPCDDRKAELEALRKAEAKR